VTDIHTTLNLLSAITPFRSVAGEIDAQRALAQWLENWLIDEVGADIILPVSQQLSPSVPPLVHARIERGAAKTVVLYNMYDVMPASEEGWEVAPFTGGLRDWPELGPVYIARGAENNKGPLASMLMAVKNLLETDGLAVNIEFILEGEEEIGSGYLRRYLAQIPCPIAPATAVLFPSLCEYGGGAPRVYLGFTGLAGGRLRVSGGSWGGPRAAIHASNASWIANPAWRLVDALNAIVPAQANGVLATLAPGDDANALLTPLAATFSIEDELRFRRSERLSVEGDTLSCLQQWLGSAVLSLSEIHTQPQGARGVIPHHAEAELAFRIPPGMDASEIIARVQAKLAAPERQGVELQLDDSYPGHRFSQQSAGVRELLSSYQSQQATPQIWPWAPGCAPAYAFAPVAPAFLIGGLGHGGNAHGTNEFVTLKGLQRFQQSLTDWLTAF